MSRETGLNGGERVVPASKPARLFTDKRNAIGVTQLAQAWLVIQRTTESKSISDVPIN
jgi:hypothetical protein